MRPLVLILLFALLAISQINTVVDSDIWCHLKTGEHIVKTLNVPRSDIFSYTLENQEWIDHSWFSQVLFYLVFAKFGWVGLNIFKAMLISLCFFVLLFLLAYKYKKFTYAVLFILLSVLAFGYRSLLRPEIFSYLLLCVFFYILEDEKRLYILPVLQVLWVNLHGYFILGPILIFLYCLGDFISGDKVKAKRFLALFFITSCACLINPYFYKGAFYPIRILASISTGQKSFLLDVQELIMPAKLSFEKYIFFWVLAILSSVTFLVNLKKARMRHCLVFLGSFIASYLAIRNTPIFIFLAMPLAAINLNEADATKNIIDKKCYIALIAVISAMIYFFVSNGYYIFTKQYRSRKTECKIEEILVPAKACDFLEKNNIKGRIFNTVDFGHYIGYRFYPEKRTFIDTRTELYKYDFYSLYRRAYNYPEAWEGVKERYHFDIVFLRHMLGGTQRLVEYLYNNKEWAMVYYDENSVIFLHDTPGNKEVIEKFKIDFSKKKILESDINLNIANLFGKIGEMKLAEDVYVKLLDRNPKFLEAGNNLAVIYKTSGRIDEALNILNRLLEYYPNSAELYVNMGTIYLRMGMKEKGLSMLETAARSNPYLREASRLLGLVYLERGYTEKAMRQFVKYLALDPYDAEAHRILGDIYKQKGLLEKAKTEYNEADRLDGK